jgi:hypothetical protein
MLNYFEKVLSFHCWYKLLCGPNRCNNFIIYSIMSMHNHIIKLTNLFIGVEHGVYSCTLKLHERFFITIFTEQ